MDFIMFMEDKFAGVSGNSSVNFTISDFDETYT